MRADRETIGKFFILLRAGLTDTLAGGFAATAEEWDAILRLAREQTVPGIVYSGISRLPESGMPDAARRIALMVEVERIAARTRLVGRVAEDLLSELRAVGLHPVILKGPAAGRHYPAPELRTSGDIDLFLNRYEYADALSFLSARGIMAFREPDGSHLYKRDGVTVEHHPRYFDLHVREELLPAVPSPEAELLMLSAHILKHAIGVGVGLRQICDIAQAYRALDGHYDRSALGAFLRKAGMARWNDLLCSFLTAYLQVPEQLLPEFRRVSPERLYEIVFAGGNFGRHRKGAKRGKLQTLKAFAQRLPFSLRLAPRETLRTLAELTKGNLH